LRFQFALKTAKYRYVLIWRFGLHQGATYLFSPNVNAEQIALVFTVAIKRKRKKSFRSLFIFQVFT